LKNLEFQAEDEHGEYWGVVDIISHDQVQAFYRILDFAEQMMMGEKE
jgi:hypothetical protein